MVAKRTALRSFDDDKELIIAIDYTHQKNHAGALFRYSDSLTLAAAATQVYLLTTPNSAKRVHLTFSIDGTVVTSVEMHEGGDRVGTTLQSTYNANRTSTITPEMLLHKDVSGGTTDGTQLLRYSSGTTTGPSKSGAEATFDTEWILKPNTKYLIRITSGTNGNLINFQPVWIEM